MKKLILFSMFLAISLFFTACMVNASVLLTFSEGTVDEIECDMFLEAQFQPDNIMRNHGFELYIKYYFKDDKLIACDHIYKFETRKEAEKWHNKYSEALNAAAGCYISETSVVKNETEPSLKGKSFKEIKELIEYSLNYIESRVVVCN